MKNVADFYPLSPMQQGLLFHSHYSPESGVYVEQIHLTITGKLDHAAFASAWERLMAHHPVLRTTFVGANLKQPAQVVHRQVALPLTCHNWQSFSPADQKKRFAMFLDSDQQQPFDLSQVPIMRLNLMQLNATNHYFVWTYHHILLDGWSIPIVFQQLFTLYEDIRLGRGTHLNSTRPYHDYIRWLQKQDMAESALYWQEVLRGFTSPTPLGELRPLTTEDNKSAQQKAHIPPDTTEKLSIFARQHQLTLNTIIQGSWALLLSRYSGEEDVLFGTVVSGRPTELVGVDSMVGLFINTLPLRVQVPDQSLLLSWLQSLQLQQVEMRQFEYTPLIKIQEWSELPKGTSLFKSLFVFENYPISSITQEQNPSLQINDINFSAKTNYPISVLAEPGSEITLQITYNSRLFDELAITRMLNHLRIILENMLLGPNQKLADISYLTPDERQTLLVTWNDTDSPFPKATCLHHLFEQQVARTPETTALVWGESRLTYQEVNKQANQLAHHLQTQGVLPGDPVGLCLDRSPLLVIGLLSILKVGGTFIALDPTYPQERLVYMLADAQAKYLLTSKKHQAKFPGYRVSCIDDLHTWANELDTNLSLPLTPDFWAYIAYTSGSTGQPKGILSRHESVVNHLSFLIKRYGLNSTNVVLQLASISFDASIRDLLGPLTAGAQVVLVTNDEIYDPVTLLKKIEMHKVNTLLSVVPTMLRSLLAAGSIIALPSNLVRLVLTSGETLHHTDYEKSKAIFGDEVLVVNQYGPTECTMTSTYYPIRALTSGQGSVLVGKPVANTQIYILDIQLQPVAVGVTGELYIGGIGISPGYLNRAGLTAARFIPNLFAATQGERLFKTGDLARFLPDGNIEFLGRNDHMVKIHGVRVELGEVEAAIKQHRAVQETAVLAQEREPGESHLAAYVVSHLENTPIIANRPRYTLPNNMAIVQANKHETDFFYQQIFVEQVELRHGITLHDGACVFDVGANIGLFTLFVQQLFKDVQVFAFEPVPPIFELLATNTRLYKGNTKVHPFGLSDKAKTAEFTHYASSSSQSGYYADIQQDQITLRAIVQNQLQEMSNHGDLSATEYIRNVVDSRTQGRTYECQLKTVSEIIAENNIACIDLLKIDVEKSEYDVLRGIQENDWEKIKQIFIEAHDVNQQISHITTLLEKHGFKVAIHQEDLLKDSGLYNIYAIRPTKEQIRQEDSQLLPVPQVENLILSGAALRTFLQLKLPQYMLPADIVFLDSLPRTPNGKINRRRLSELDVPDQRPTDTFVPPSTPQEQALANIWAEVLSVEKVGIHDSFFDLGGDSLSSMRVVFKAHQAGFNLTLQQIFEHGTISQLLTQADLSPKICAEQGMVTGSVPFSHTQAKFLNEAERASTLHYWTNGPLLEIVETMSAAMLKEAARALVFHHDMLRLRVVYEDGQWQQFIVAPEETIALKTINLATQLNNEDDHQAIKAEIIAVVLDILASMTIRERPLFQIIHIDLGPQRPSYLLPLFHYLNADPTTWRIVVEDFHQICQQLKEGQPVQLPPKTTSFKEFAERLVARTQSAEGKESLAYWLAKSWQNIAKLPQDYNKGPNSIKSLASVYVSLTIAETQTLLQNLSQQVQIQDMLTTALVQTVATWTGSSKLLLDIQNFGRATPFPDIDITRTAGWFAYRVPTLFDTTACSSLGDVLAMVKEQLRHTILKGFDYSLFHTLSPNDTIRQRLHAMPLAQICLNNFGVVDQISSSGTVQTSLFKFADFINISLNAPHTEQLTFLLDIQPRIYKKQLYIEWLYSQNLYQQTTIKRLANNYLAILRQLVFYHLPPKEDR